MQREALRLEVLKLVYHHGRDTAEVVGRARELEKYLLEPEPKVSSEAGQVEAEKLKPGRSRKGTGNSTLLE
jgi:hypothetical protein